MRMAAAAMLSIALLLEGCGWFRRKPQTPPAPPAQAPKPRAVKRKPAQPAAKPKTSPEPAAPEPRPQLGQLHTEEEKAEFRHAYEQSIAAASDLLAGLAGRQLSGTQQDSVARIKSFLDQAREATGSNWSLAAQLARRAELLARDLVRTTP